MPSLKYCAYVTFTITPLYFNRLPQSPPDEIFAELISTA